jgi:uncharacterized repeat protein (TIGR03843 family)
LLNGRVASRALVPRGSNYTYLVTLVCDDGSTGKAIYKPQQGENPLWDFPYGSLCLRERAAYLVAEALGWRFIPPTVVRNGPNGLGSMQHFIEHDPACHYFTIREEHEEDFKRMFAFDWLTNNADRKSGHCLVGADGRVYGIDHGLTFHAMPKLRTVMWDYAGLPIPSALLRDLEAFGASLGTLRGPLVELPELLSSSEIAALKKRLETILQRRKLPETHEGGIPWPWL